MQYLCEKQLTAGEVTYHPGEIIPDGVILPERSGKLIRSGYISELNLEMPESVGSDQESIFTGKEVDAMISDAVVEVEKGYEKKLAALFTHDQVEKMLSEAVEEAVNNTILEMKEKQGFAESTAIEPPGYRETIQISVKSESDGQYTAIPVSSEEIQQVFSILQMNVEEGIKVIADVASETVLILLQAADSRKTIKNAVKEQADRLFLAKSDSNESDKGNETTGTNTEGVDT